MIDEFEMKNILSNKELVQSLNSGFADMKARKGRFVE